MFRIQISQMACNVYLIYDVRENIYYIFSINFQNTKRGILTPLHFLQFFAEPALCNISERKYPIQEASICDIRWIDR